METVAYTLCSTFECLNNSIRNVSICFKKKLDSWLTIVILEGVGIVLLNYEYLFILQIKFFHT
jgi:hypothetical protein